MKVSIEIPPDIEKLLLKKCEKSKLNPSEFILSLLEWYFLKWRKSRIEGGSGFIKIANQCAIERVKYCKYSDGKRCAREVLNDLVTEKEPEPIVPYRCLFCMHFIDRRVPKAIELEKDAIDQTYEIARVAARLVVELYKEKLGYKPALTMEEIEKEITKEDVESLLENW